MWETVLSYGTTGLLYGAALVLAAVGLVGCVLPFPGHLCVLAGCTCAVLGHGSPYPAWWHWVILAALTALGMVVDTMCSMAGAKTFGGSKAAMWAVIPGAIVGAFFAPIGLLAGPFIAAFLAEVLIMRHSLGKSTVSGIGATLGYVGGVAGRTLVAAIMIAYCWIFML
ncbi:MAG: DUF456 domain-containing protein [Akkermansia sp.]|nr:DUF456 domain-containing protein [Akkermansia sp.]